ncbi:NAD(P)-dependent dehydrogenase (short-subunit alcohol dehydrogenase family) [Asanoa ferruginea]|uniref:NAD(P)-dependent dehydrogenase (Short-subunit alcohol dehydrogenase family) n=1 Tax=Asanoa ferruginea TaxID=53367 RepID=A0A3D9ZBE6_9ACTN|nr:oxidoreductase [Asanoa ferruginea]REF94615.1 NAD(P)-dependent dehydrogenase (short-subunit alcohol dehydrogenase family) [Asanoa ferruginea]GIF50804.1 putative short-chain dehydrogenase/reductase [Asanoa ferruginea]
MTKFTTADVPDLSGRTAIVTGANGGLGLETARALAGAGARVVFAVRNAEKGRAAADSIPGETEVRTIDLASLDSVRAFAAGWQGPIDLLINNAAVAVPELRRTADGFELQFGTNHLGPFALTNLLLCNVTDRVVTVASQAERLGRIDFDDPNDERHPYERSTAYNRSKLANLLFTAELQRRLAAAGSTVLAEAAHPGFLATGIYSDSGRRTQILVRLLAQKPDAGALPVLYAAVADLPGNSFAGPSHLGHMRGAPELIGRSTAAQDPQLAARLWSLSEQLTGTTFPL